MSYISGTITDSNAPATLYNSIATALTDEGFVSIDTVTISANTHKVWKSPAAENTANKDWYLDVQYPTAGGGTIYFTPYEDYNATTDLGFRGPVNIGTWATMTTETTYYSRYGATGYSLEHANWWRIGLTAPVTSFGFWISITADRVVGLSSNEPSKVVYTGLYTPSAGHTASATTWVYPLITAQLDGAGGGYAGYTRFPKIVGTIGNQGGGGSTQVAPFRLAGYLPGTSVPAGVNGAYSYREASPIQAYNNDPQTGMSWFGTLQDVATVNAALTVARGDTVTIGADQWVACTVASGTTSTTVFKAI